MYFINVTHHDKPVRLVVSKNIVIFLLSERALIYQLKDDYRLHRHFSKAQDWKHQKSEQPGWTGMCEGPSQFELRALLSK